MASIIVKYETDDTALLQQGYKMRVTAHTAVGMPTEIFVLKAIPGPAGREADEFDHVASAPDIQETPATAPAGTNPFYRVAVIELYFRTPAELAETQAAIDADVTELLAALNTAYELETETSYGE